MTITMHSCRGNFRSTFIASGGYEFVAEQLLGHTGLDGYFLEYDTERAGGFEPLRYFPKGDKQVVLGLVTSKSGVLEKKDDIKRRIDEATKYVALEQLCLDRGRQCAF
jgi:5-methyltetrahydropteroyltriglutamate--homocysteine methyltransferase